MAFRIRKLGWKAGCVGLALFAGTQTGRLQAAPQDETDKVVPASAVSSAIVDSLIDDAMQDGSISAEERRLIMGQARRRLNGTEVAEVEARIASLPATPAAMGYVTTNTTTGAGLDDAKADNGKSCCDEPGCGGYFDNMYIFGATDGWADPIDEDFGNNFGFRIGANMGIPLDQCRGIGGQFGLSYGFYNFHGRDEGNERSSTEEQLFFTTGVFKRADLCSQCPDRISWGLVYDLLVTDNLGKEAWEVGIDQLRGQVGYALDANDEVGLSLALHLRKDKVDGPSNNENNIHSLDQASLYWHHKWCWDADTTLFTGLAENPGNWLIGAKGEVPISNSVSLFGSWTFFNPSSGPGDSHEGNGSDRWAEEIWNVSVGVAYYPGGNATSKTVAGRRWMPLLPVADNGTMAIKAMPQKL